METKYYILTAFYIKANIFGHFGRTEHYALEVEKPI